MESVNVTFGETAGVQSAQSDPYLRALVTSLKQKVDTLEKELEGVKAELQKLKQSSGQISEELVDQRYQIYFKAPRTKKEVVKLMQQIVLEAIVKHYVKKEQPCKLELVEDEQKPSWRAIRLTTKGGSSSLFRGIGKTKVSAQEDSDTLRTQ